MAKLTCLVCLQKYLKPEDDNLYSPYQPRLLSSPPTSSVPNDNLYTRFLHLCTRHLKLNLATQPLTNGRRDNSAFCPKCKCLVSYLCDLYNELEVVKLHLHWKLEELGKQIKWGRGHGSQNALAEELNVNSVRDVNHFRMTMKQICTRKGSTPKLVIVRGLLPEMWKFPYSETRSALARLIFLFALASKKLCSKPEVNQPILKEEGDYHPQNSDYGCGGDSTGFQSEADSDWSNPSSPSQSDEDYKPSELGTRRIRKRKLPRSYKRPTPKKRKTSKKNNSDLTKLDCPKCSRKFIQPKSLASHIERHNKRSWLKEYSKYCLICCSKGGNELQTFNHMPTHNINSDKNNPCHACGEWFENEFFLSKHFEEIHQGKFCCLQPQCNAKCETPAELSTHLKSHEGPEKPFHCYFCSRNFTTEQFLRIHITSHENTLLICDNLECSKQFENVTELNDHLKSHLEPDKGISHCSKCNWGFLSETDLRLHQLQHTPHSNLNKGGYNCPKCSLQFTYIPTLLSHFYNIHLNNDSSPLKCSDCEYTTFSPTYFKLHNIAHAKAQAIFQNADLKCDICEKEFIDKMAFRIHKQINHNKIARRVYEAPNPARKRYIPDSTCKLCKEDLESLTNLEKHMVSMHDNQNGFSHQCWFCPKRFSLQETLLVHRWSEHFRKVVFRCDAANCNQFFYCVEEHEEHLISHLQDAPTGSSFIQAIYHCPKCNLGYLNSSLLEYHELVHLERITPNGIGEEGFPCPKCDQIYHDKQLLLPHYRENHMDYNTVLKFHRRDTDKIWTCKNCTFSTKTQHLLHQHMKKRHPGTTHTCHMCGLVLPNRRAKLTHLEAQHKIQSKEYPCHLCGTPFLLPSSLKNHIRNVHCERRFVCDVCGKAFKAKEPLINHKDRYHDPNRTKEHICSSCGKAFWTKGEMEYHMDSVHAPEEEKRFGCPYCPKRYHRQVSAKMHVKTCMQKRGMEVPDDLDQIEVEWSAAAITQLVKHGRRKRSKLKGAKSGIKN